MMGPLSIIITVVALYGRDVSGFDLFSCYDMVPPGITEAPQSSPSPYAVNVSPAVYQDGVPITVTIASVDDTTTFTDFLIEALCVTCANTVIPVGTFTKLPSGAEILPCFGTKAAVMATTGSNKKSITLSWTPTSNFNGIVIMRASIVQSGSVWWGDIASRALEGKEASVWYRNMVPQALERNVVKRQVEPEARRRTTTTTTPTTTTASAATVGITLFVNLLAFAVTLCV